MKNYNFKLKFIKLIRFGFKFLLVIFTFSFLLSNLIYSQLVSPLYFQLAKEDRVAMVIFLHKIEDLKDFNLLMAMNKNIYGNSLEQEVFAENVKRKQKIEEYELLLQKNPHSRDTLYNLHILYLEDGDEIRAEEYLKKTKEIDPTIENNF